ncbi:MAG: hypothetical protein M1820_010215 [Bogoriella megaspora]|nr:MAG: hypothetical protein M1820_010215 [Bogoriella megaspora]
MAKLHRCQRETGSAFALNAMIETAHLTMLTSTAPAAYPIPSPSGDGQIMLRCPKCLIAVFSDYGGHPFVRMVRVGTLDHAAEVKPGVHIYTSTKCPWIDLSKEREAGVPIFEETYDKQQVWGPGALKRREEFLPKVMEYFEGLKKGNEEQAKGN